MEEVAKYTNYDCWHAITMVLFAMAGGYAYAAFVPAGWDVAALFTFLAAAFAVWIWVLTFLSKRTAFELPQWTLFLAISVAAGWGLLT